MSRREEVLGSQISGYQGVIDGLNKKISLYTNAKSFLESSNQIVLNVHNDVKSAREIFLGGGYVVDGETFAPDKFSSIISNTSKLNEEFGRLIRMTNDRIREFNNQVSENQSRLNQAKAELSSLKKTSHSSGTHTHR